MGYHTEPSAGRATASSNPSTTTAQKYIRVPTHGPTVSVSSLDFNLPCHTQWVQPPTHTECIQPGRSTYKWIG